MMSGETGAPAEIDALQGGQCDAGGAAVIAQAVQERRGAEHGGDPVVLDDVDDLFRIGIGRPGGSISGMMAVIPRAGSKREKSGKVGRSISSGPMLKCFWICRTWASKFPWV